MGIDALLGKRAPTTHIPTADNPQQTRIQDEITREADFSPAQDKVYCPPKVSPCSRRDSGRGGLGKVRRRYATPTGALMDWCADTGDRQGRTVDKLEGDQL